MGRECHTLASPPMLALLTLQATFLQQQRGGGVDVGYVSTGHFAGEFAVPRTSIIADP